MSDDSTAAGEFAHASGNCGLCGNYGVVDTRGLMTPAGFECGVRAFCVCANGRAWKSAGADVRQIDAAPSPFRSMDLGDMGPVFSMLNTQVPNEHYAGERLAPVLIRHLTELLKLRAEKV